MRSLIANVILGVTIGIISAMLIGHLCAAGNYPNNALHEWFDKLASGKGLCCSFADGVSLEDFDWDMQTSKYRVRLGDKWIVVPDDAVITEPNKYGPAVVWPYQDYQGVTQIRCFLPGTMS